MILRFLEMALVISYGGSYRLSPYHWPSIYIPQNICKEYLASIEYLILNGME